MGKGTQSLLAALFCAALHNPVVYGAPPTHAPPGGKPFVVIAHRGASAYAPEETMAAFTLAKAMGADYIEMDLQITKDGVLVLMHDPTVNRTTNGKGPVKSYTLRHLETLETGTWFNRTHPRYAKPEYTHQHVPALDEVLDTLGHGANYYIEVKAPQMYPGVEEKLVTALKRHHLVGPGTVRGQVVVESFDPQALKRIHRMEPTLPLVQLVDGKDAANPTPQQVRDWKTCAVGVAPNYTRLTPQAVGRLRASGLRVEPWTVDSPVAMRRLMRWGVTGMFTDRPDVLRSVWRATTSAGAAPESTRAGSSHPARPSESAAALAENHR